MYTFESWKLRNGLYDYCRRLEGQIIAVLEEDVTIYYYLYRTSGDCLVKPIKAVKVLVKGDGWFSDGKDRTVYLTDRTNTVYQSGYAILFDDYPECYRDDDIRERIYVKERDDEAMMIRYKKILNDRVQKLQNKIDETNKLIIKLNFSENES